MRRGVDDLDEPPADDRFTREGVAVLREDVTEGQHGALLLNVYESADVSSHRSTEDHESMMANQPGT